MLLLQKK